MRLIKSDYLPSEALSEFDRLFERAFSDFSGWPGFRDRRAVRSFRIDAFQDEANHYVVAELPGFDRQDIDVELENQVLTITAGHDSKAEGEDKPEGRSMKVSRSIAVDKAIQADQVSAKLENGLLTVTLPKAEERRPRMIEVS